MKTKLTLAQRQALIKWCCLMLAGAIFCLVLYGIPHLAKAMPKINAQAAEYLIQAPDDTVPTGPLFTIGSGNISAAEESVTQPEDPENNGEYEPENPIPEINPADGDKPVYPSNLCWYEVGETHKLSIINKTKFSVSLNDFAQREYPIKGNISKEPLVLIVHTHGTESYLPAGYEYYNPKNGYRSHDESQTVVHVGSVLCEKLNALGIPTVQDKTMYDKSNFNKAYTNSKAGITAMLKKYPTIKYVIDLHRDSVFDSDGNNIKPLTEIEGEKCAQLMLVIGTNEGGAAHPNWRDNLTFGTYLQKEINALYPTLMRPVNLRASAFNQALTKGSIILEVGSCGNNMTEAENAVIHFAEAYAKVLKENM